MIDQNAPAPEVIEILSGAAGNALILNGTRIAGPKAWGGGTITARFMVDRDAIISALNEKTKETA